MRTLSLASSISSPPISVLLLTRSQSSLSSPMLKALHGIIVPSLSPPARLPPSPAPSRPEPLISSLGYTSPSVCSLTTEESPIALALSRSRSYAVTASSTSPSIDALQSIPTSTIFQTRIFPSLRRWWSRSDSDTSQSIASAPNEPHSLNVTLGKRFRAPNAPLVFCHGLLGFDSLTIGPAIASVQVSHWGGIGEALEAMGCEVLITRVPATSSPVDRAKVLEKKISETYPDRDVHLISHSMGGIDCRYLITHLTQRTFRVLSLTTISTPHHGSSFASHFLSLASTRFPIVLALLQLLPNGNGNGKAFECLTKEAMKEFNDNTPDIEGVRYFSWGAEYEPSFIDPWKYSHSTIAAHEGANDGMVSVQSAQWGTYLGTLRNVNHIDAAGWTGKLAGNLTRLGGREYMHAFSCGNLEFCAERFYGGVADLLADVEEEEGYAVDGRWVGSEGREERKKTKTNALTGTEEAVPDKATWPFVYRRYI